MTKTPSPCIDVCKYKRKGHCIGCGMTKSQKSLFKGLKKAQHQAAFVEMLLAQQSHLGRYDHWAHAYLRKCEKKNVKPIKALRGS